MLITLLELGEAPPGLSQVAFGFTCVGVLVSEDAPHPRHGVLEEFLGKYPIVSRASSGHQDHTHVRVSNMLTVTREREMTAQTLR